MNLGRLIVREMRFRRLNTALSALSVAVAVGCFAATHLLLGAFDRQTEAWVAGKEAELRTQMTQMEDEFRRLTKRMGFNVVILPKDQNLADFYAENYADKFMPESSAKRLAEATNMVTIRHVLPMLQQKVEWPERQRRVLLIGVQGRAAGTHRAGEEPLIRPVATGTVALGHELHRSLGLTNGMSVAFMGRTFTVSALHPERGSVDDVTLWMDLAQAQELLGRQGQINSIVALECECAWANLPKVRAEIQGILPDTQVIELAGKALARAEAREEAARNARQALEREKRARAELRARRERLAGVLVPLALAACAAWVGFLSWTNARERRVEIGVLRALGLRSRDVLAVFLGRAALVGLAGAALGAAGGLAVGARLGGAAGLREAASLFGAQTLVGLLVLAPALTVVAAWLPALMAARMDPSEALREE